MERTPDERRDEAGTYSSEHMSPPRSMPGSPGGKGKKRVGFHVKNVDSVSSSKELSPPEFGDEVSRQSSVSNAIGQPGLQRAFDGTSSPEFDETQLTKSLDRLRNDSTPTVLKSALRKGMVSRDNRPEPLDLAGIDDLGTKLAAEHHARARASGLERDVASAPGSRSGSPSRSLNGFTLGQGAPPHHLVPTGHGRDSGHHQHVWSGLFHKGGAVTGQNTPDAEELEEYFPEPTKYRAGGLSAHLLSNWWKAGGGFHSRSSSFGGADSTPSSPGAMTPTLHVSPPRDDSGNILPTSRHHRPWSWSRSPRRSDFGIENLVAATASSTAIGGGSDIGAEYRKATGKRPDYFSTASSSSLTDFWYQGKKRRKADIDITIKKHVQETERRKKYILKLCRALMEYGAPTHRLEAYLSMSSRVLEIQAQFLYFPGTMFISFDDTQTHTAEMKLVRVAQGVDLGKMKDTHNIYKDVSHDLIGVDEGIKRLETLTSKKPKYPVWLRVLAYGLGSASVSPFAFEGRFIDLPICFGLGLILGFLQLVVAPKSDLYASLFEIVATIITSFLSRLFGSINYPGTHHKIFCFSTLAQSSIAIILPGFTVLSAALELQSRSIVAGSVRIVYAIVYSLWIGYGLTIGTAVYGAINHYAESKPTCHAPLASTNPLLTFPFVVTYTFSLCIINQAKWRQMPMMILISFAGYQVNYWSSTKFQGNTQVASTLGSAVIGVLANGYSRVGRRVDEQAARFESWVETTVRRKLFGKSGLRNSARPQGQRRRSSVTDAILSLLPKPLRPKSPEAEKDIEASSSSPDEDDPRSDAISQATTADGGAEADEAKPAANEPPRDENGKPMYGAKIGRDGKPKQVNYVLAASTMLPAIFVLVPSGVGVAGSLISGVAAANQLTNSSTAGSSDVLSALQVVSSNGNIDTGASFGVAASVVQVAIGITIGLFIGSVIVYPTGKGGAIGQGKKSRSGLFTF